LDGITHEEKSVKAKDRIKQDKLESLGYTVLRFKDEDVVYSLEDVEKEIKEWITEFEKIHPEVIARRKRRKRS